jgi:hypothetical protein
LEADAVCLLAETSRSYAEPRCCCDGSNFPPPATGVFLANEAGGWMMAWCIGRTEALADPIAARRKALAKLRGLEDVDDPESLVVPILIDAILMAESYRGARHEVTFLSELTRSVDALIRELNAVEKAREWAEPVTGA